MVVPVVLCALLIGSSCSGGEGAGGEASTTTAARPAPPGPPTDACALLDEGEVEAISPGASRGAGDDGVAGEGTETDVAGDGSLPGGAASTRYADCSWPATEGASLYLTWVQPSPTPSATTWLERTIVQSADPVGMVVEPLEAEVAELDAALLVQDDTVLRVAGVVSGTDLITIEVLHPPVAEGSTEQEALVAALELAAGRLLGQD